MFLEKTEASDLAESLNDQARRYAFTLPDDAQYFQRQGYRRKDVKPICRILGERAVVRQAVTDILAATGDSGLGYTISVFDGEMTAVSNSQNLSAIMDAIMATDEDVLVIRSVQPDGEPVYQGRILLLYGSGSADVVADYSARLKSLLTTAQTLGESIAACA